MDSQNEKNVQTKKEINLGEENKSKSAKSLEDEIKSQYNKNQK